jgi:hypothetical protein
MLTRFMNAFVEQLGRLSANSTATALGVLALLGVAAARLLPPAAWIPITVGISLAIVLLTRLLLKRLFVVYPRLSGDHEVLLKHFVYRLDTSGNGRRVIYRRRYKIRALRRLEVLKEAFLWTGSDSSLPVVVGGTLEIGEVKADTIWRVMDLRLPRTLEKDEVFEFELEWRLDDQDRKSKTFFSAPINESTRHLIFDLYLPEESGVAEALMEERRSIDSLSAFRQERLQLVDGHARWEKRDPGKYFYYCMKWREPGSVIHVTTSTARGSVTDNSRSSPGGTAS